MQAEEMFDERYRVVDRLGAGSEGEVFLALYVPTEEFRAVKKIRTGENENYCRELEMLKGVRCEHLPRIIDVLPGGEYTYLVMEHVRGTSVDRILAGGRNVTQDQALEAALQITDALCYLESRDPPVCHLDIKPSNLIRRPDGRFVLVDFGASWKENTCRPGKGTDGYAAPEQYDAQGVTDVRSDIYGLGAVLYRMLSGKTWSEQMRGSRVPNCCEEFGRIIGRCLEPDMSMRWESAKDLRRELVRLRRRENRRRLRVRVLGALAIAFPAAAFQAAMLPPSMALPAGNGWDYESLLEEAQVCGEEEARSFYRRAVLLAPERSEAYMQYLEDAGSDACLSADEDLFLRDLLHTVVLGEDVTNEEKLAEDSPGYGQVALKTALLYWHCCGEEDGKRIAAGWFDRAVRAADRLDAPQRNSCLWYEAACLYSDMASVLKLVQGRAEGRQDPEDVKRFWDIQGKLMGQVRALGSVPEELEFCRDALYDLSFLCAELERAGVSVKDQRERVQDLTDSALKLTGSSAQQELTVRLEEQIQEAASLALAAQCNRENTDGRKRDE